MTQTECLTESCAKAVLLACEELGRTQGEFTFADAVIAAWKRNPAMCGMREYPEYPCSNRVGSVIYGNGHLLSQGLIVRLRPGVFTMAGGGHATTKDD